MSTIITATAIQAESKAFASTIATGRSNTQNATVRVGLFMADVLANGGTDEDGVAYSQNTLAKALGLPKGTGQRAPQVGAMIRATGVTSWDDVTDRESAREIVKRNNAGGTKALTDDMRKAVIDAEPESLKAVLALLDGMLAEVKDDRDAEAKAAKAEREAEAERAASPAGKVDALAIIAADITVMLAAGGLTLDEASRVQTIIDGLNDALEGTKAFAEAA